MVLITSLLPMHCTIVLLKKLQRAMGRLPALMGSALCLLAARHCTYGYCLILTVRLHLANKLSSYFLNPTRCISHYSFLLYVCVYVFDVKENYMYQIANGTFRRF